MKRKNKILACTLSAMLLVSSMAVPVFAAESEQNFDILSSPISIDQNKDQKIDESIAKDTLYSFLTKLKEGKVAEAEEYLVDETNLGIPYADIVKMNPLVDFSITDKTPTVLDESTIAIPTIASMENGEVMEIPLHVSVKSGKYKVHIFTTPPNEPSPYTILQESRDTKEFKQTLAKSAQNRSIGVAVDTYSFSGLYGNLNGLDKFGTLPGTMGIEGSQSPDNWPGGNNYPIKVRYAIGKPGFFGNDEFGSGVISTSGSFKLPIIGTKMFTDACIYYHL